MNSTSKVGSGSFHQVEDDPNENRTNTKSSSPNVTQAQVNKMIENQPLPALSARKNVMNAEGVIRQEPSDYQLKAAEAELKEPSSAELAEPQQILRQAIDPSQDPNEKFGFPHSFFDHAFVSTDQRGTNGQKLALPKGREVQLKKDGMQPETPASRLLNMMPSRMTQDDNLKRLSSQEDPGKQSVNKQSDSNPKVEQSGNEQSDSDPKVSSGKFFESAAALKYAQQEGYDPSTVQRHSTTIDFRATNQKGEEVHFDTFESPRPNQLSNQQRDMQYTLENMKKDDSNKTALEKKVKSIKSKTPSVKKWAEDTYTSHTNESKGTKVTGVWDQTSTSGAELKKLQEAVGDKPGNAGSVDLDLLNEYAREDNLARQQIDHRNNRDNDQNVKDTDNSKT